MRPELEQRGLEIVTVSTDTPEEIARGRHRHGLKATMLSDPELLVTDKFGLRNQGVHITVPGKAPALPVPTSLLVDAGGTVVWMDQSEHYQQRADLDKVGAAMCAHFD